MPGYWLTRMPYGAYAIEMLHCSCNAQSFGLALALAHRVAARLNPIAPMLQKLCVLRRHKMVEMKKPRRPKLFWIFVLLVITFVLLVSIHQTNGCGSCRFLFKISSNRTIRQVIDVDVQLRFYRICNLVPILIQPSVQ